VLDVCGVCDGGNTCDGDTMSNLVCTSGAGSGPDFDCNDTCFGCAATDFCGICWGSDVSRDVGESICNGTETAASPEWVYDFTGSNMCECELTDDDFQSQTYSCFVDGVGSGDAGFDSCGVCGGLGRVNIGGGGLERCYDPSDISGETTTLEILACPLGH
jgi:hypothetical protein